ncbi:MAG TPA: Druantia anti-phage system protein DruA [Solirubrobacterales bacterium]|nr:Druantia anti-phage system protein DruA [Solirubrobacterales bacterium]
MLDDRLIESPERMRKAVVESLRAQGFVVEDGVIKPPPDTSKAALRSLHADAVAHQRERSRAGLARHEDRLITRIANGEDVVAARIRPRVSPVQRGSEEEMLFRWTRLHWSIPTSAGYGRRLRFVVTDESNGMLIGIIGLADPVYALASRDRWIGWDADAKRARLQRIMDAFVLGAVPPYRELLAGKLVAMLTTSAEVQQTYGQVYGGRTTRISERNHGEPLALLTTTSALGRSSIYNRLRVGDRPVATSVGFTGGSGDFQFANGLYDGLFAYAKVHCTPTAKHARWGSGFRNRREVVKKALVHLGLSDALLYHGVRREVFVFPLAVNARQALASGEPARLRTVPADELADYWRSRWLLPRAERKHDYRRFKRAAWRLWPR